MFHLEIDTSNAAFDNDGTQNSAYSAEIVRILKVVAEQVSDGQVSAPVRDTNGNTVGRFEWREE